MKPFRNIRVLPVVLVAVFGLAVLKIAGLVLDGGYVFDNPPDAANPPPERAGAGGAANPEPVQGVSASERAILERLQARRQELEARAREIDIRESLLKSAEKRIETRVEELKAVESRINVATEQKTEAD